MARLWQVMGNTFMHKWTSYAGDIDSPCFNDWAKALADLSEENIAAGVNQIPSLPPNAKGEHWPPAIPEFRALCKPKKYQYHTGALKALTAPKRTEETARAAGDFFDQAKKIGALK